MVFVIRPFPTSWLDGAAEDVRRTASSCFLLRYILSWLSANAPLTAVWVYVCACMSSLNGQWMGVLRRLELSREHPHVLGSLTQILTQHVRGVATLTDLFPRLPSPDEQAVRVRRACILQ